MIQLSDEQLHNLNKEALIVIVSSLQEQLDTVRSQLDSANSMLADNTKQIELLTEQIRLMNQRHFGKKAEGNLIDAEGNVYEQYTLFDSFNEAEASSDPKAPEPTVDEVAISSYKRAKRKGKREADLDGLPARIFEHRLSDEELLKKFPGGYKELPEEVYKRLHIIPETFIVDEHHVHIYASKDNDDVIVRAPRPKDLFRNSIATPALVASIINGKYANALPIERQAKAYRCNGINLATNTMSNWVIRSAEEYISLLYDRLHELIYDFRVLHADETPVKVMRIDGQKVKGGRETRMWVYRNNPKISGKPIILFEWQPTRKADHPREFLKKFSGVLVTDGYQVYHTLDDEREDIKVAGCWVHARRPFAEFIKSLERNGNPAKDTIAHEAYAMITEIMHTDNTYDDLSPRDRRKQRQLHLKEKVDAYFVWVKEKYMMVAPKSVIGKALAYSINQEKYLRVFLTDGNVPMDNNYAEQAIRPFTVGRKNFVCIESSVGAKASAMLYSIVETARANQLNPYKYFELLLSEIPAHMNDKDLKFVDELLPWSPKVQKECASQFKKK